MDASARFAVALLCGALINPVAHAAEPAALLEGFDRRVVTLESADGRCFRVDAWLATSPSQLRQGLMWIQSMAAHEGMLFAYDPPRRASMWMKNTLISLDMLFVSDDGEILQVAANTRPKSLRSIRSRSRVGWVLELNAGSAERWQIEPGARMTVHEGLAASISTRLKCERPDDA